MPTSVNTGQERQKTPNEEFYRKRCHEVCPETGESLVNPAFPEGPQRLVGGTVSVSAASRDPFLLPIHVFKWLSARHAGKLASLRVCVRNTTA